LRPSESYENWPHVIARWDGWRVIGCRDDMQWILQRGRKGGSGTQWAGISYCRTKPALARCIRQKVGEIPAFATAALDALPERYPEGRRPANSNTPPLAAQAA